MKLPAMKLIFKDEKESLSTKKLSQEVEGWRFNIITSSGRRVEVCPRIGGRGGKGL